jgi:tRNA (cytidine/uridine-2'-O-)-methyltransferase
MIGLALYQPDIPQNAGAILRLAACFGAPIHVVHPAAFDLSDRRLRRAGMDYLAQVELIQHDDWKAFQHWRAEAGTRLVALSARADTPLTGFAFQADDILLLGRESAGLPPAVLDAADTRLHIPIRPPTRSLNVALAASIALWEALRQTGALPSPSVPAPDRLSGGP